MKSIHLPMLALCAILFGACDVGGLPGNGHSVTQQRSAAPFLNVQAGGAFQIEWRKGPPSVIITTDENLQRYIESNVSNGVLHLKTTRSLNPGHHGVKVALTSSALEGVELNGASRLTAHGLGGSRFYVESNGATKIISDGAVDELIATMNGASDFQGEHLQTKRAELAVHGAGKAVVAVSDSLDVSIAGAGKVEYIGSPAQIKREIAGAGSIRRKD